MSTAVHVKTKVLPGHRIEIQVPELPEGRDVTVFVVSNEETPPKRPLKEIMAEHPGTFSFRSAEEVDAYLKEERDSWDR